MAIRAVFAKFCCTAKNYTFSRTQKFSKYSQTCVQRPPLKPQKSGRCSEGGCCSEVGPKYLGKVIVGLVGQSLLRVLANRHSYILTKQWLIA
jgi:hypothetical protein